MTIIHINSEYVTYDKETRTLTTTERYVTNFQTSYLLKNMQTGGEMQVDFKEMTGPEFDPNTASVYKSKNNELTFVVKNDPIITKRRGEMYLKAKMYNANPGSYD